MTLDEVQKLLPNCKIIPLDDGRYIALPTPLTEQERDERCKRIEKYFSIHDTGEQK